MGKQVFKAKEGASFGNEKSQIYGEELERIRKLNGGILTPQLVIEAAKQKGSPLHDFFDWDMKTAAEKHWLNQARFLISHIEIEIIHEGTAQKQRAYLNVTAADENDETQRIYVTVERALSVPELKKQVLASAIREIEYWKNKYQGYNEFALIFNSIKATKQKYKL